MATITRRMEAVLTNLNQDFKNLYCKEDFEHKIYALKLAENKSNKPSIQKELFQMFDNCDINYERGKRCELL